ncbi:hypothetical protein PG984_009926 [Apiospora sp. TS-2023a]
MYGDNEELLGKWFKRSGKRDQIFLTTKFGFQKGSYTDIDTSAAFCKKSLRLLGTDYIDLYYMHRASPNTPIGETMVALLELKAEGKIKHIGLCEVSANTLRRACKVGQGVGPEGACRELGVSIIAYAPLGRGLLTGALSTKQSVSGEGDYRASLYPRFSEEHFEANVKIINQIESMAAEKGCTAAQLAIAWVLRQGDDFIPIPGTKRIKYLEENVGAIRVEITNAEEKRMRDTVPAVAGERVAEFAKYHCYVDTVEE